MSTSSHPFGDFSTKNPFLTAAPVAAASPLQCGPRIESPDVEIAGSLALEITVRWGEQILHVGHVLPPSGERETAREIAVGEEGNVVYRLPSEKLGTSRLLIARVERTEVIALVGTCGPLAKGTRTKHVAGDFSIELACVAAAKKPVRSSMRRAGIGFWAASAALHVAVVAGLMMSPGESLDSDDAGLDKSTQAYVMQLQKNSADKEIPEQDTQTTPADHASNDGGKGAKHVGADGQMGDPSKKQANNYYSVKGPADTTEIKIAKTRALIESNNYGAIGALASVFGSSANAPVIFDSVSNETVGKDPANFNGNMMGTQAGDAFGYGGLGLAGTGPGAGGFYDGIGLGSVGGFGHGPGTGDNVGWGGGPGGKPMTHKTKPIKMIDVGGEVTGKLPAETIKRIIRANFPRFRACYESGLKKDPGLRGTVTVRFIIDSMGATENASLGGGTLPEPGVQSCVLGVYRTLSFPEPEGGKVMVTYPIDFQND